MKKKIYFLCPAFMLAFSIFVVKQCLTITEDLDTKTFLVGSTDWSVDAKTILIGIFVAGMFCLPGILAILFDKEKWSLIYSGLIVIGTIIGKGDFCQIFLSIVAIPGYLFGLPAEIITAILKIFSRNMNGTFLIGLCQIAGHLFTTAILAMPSLLLDIVKESAEESKGTENAYMNELESSVLNRDLLYEARRNRIEQEKIDRLERIERELRDK